MKTMCIAILAFLAFSVQAQVTPDKIVGKWENQLKSVMTVSSFDEPSQSFKGSFVTVDGTRGELSGFVNESPAEPGKDHVIVVSFLVRWIKNGSVTAWSGYFNNPSEKAPSILANWNLVRSNSSYSWDHILTNSDLFVYKGR